MRAVAGRASKSTGAFYQNWETQAGYVLELVPYMLRSNAGLDPLASTDELKEAEPDRTSQRPSWRRMQQRSEPPSWNGGRHALRASLT